MAAVEASAPFSKTYYTISDWDGITLDAYPELKEVARVKLGETDSKRAEARCNRVLSLILALKHS